MNKSFVKKVSLAGSIALAIFASVVASQSQAAITDISQSPVSSSRTAVVKSNIMLLMDTSTSMGWTHMPDDIETTTVFPVGYRNYQCNAMYYNPNKVYKRPKGPTGLLDVPDFNAARYNYYSSDTSVVDLRSAFQAFDANTRRIQGSAPGVNDTPQAAYYYLYSGTAAATASYKTSPCTDADTGAINTATTFPATDGGTWTRKLVTATSGPGASDERQNFAIWYTYYRTRLGLMKSGIALAFAPLSSNYRVGFISMNPTNAPGTADSPVNASKYLALGDFDTTQRTNWFAKLFSQTASGSSPAREGLARVGRYYAGATDKINKSMGSDPVQYSCQQNFTIMTTDGYWNAAQEGNGPVGLDGVTPVGQQDGTLTDNSGLTPRPIWDGGIGGSRIITDQSNTYAYANCSGGWFNMTTSQITITTAQNLQRTNQITQSTSQRTISTAQITKATSQITKATSQLTQSTAQINQRTSQTTQSTSQNNYSTSQLRQSTSRIDQSTAQVSASTSQLTRSTFQNTATTSQVTQSTAQINKSTSQINKSTSQLQQSTSQLRVSTSQTSQSTAQIKTSTSQLTLSTSQLTQSTSQTAQSTSQLNKSTSQLTQNTSQLTQSTTQIKQSTSQLTQSTSQLQKSTQQLRQSTSQTFSYDAATEQSTPVSSCTPGGNISCSTMTTGPTPVASCTADSPTVNNGYTTTTCASVTTGPTGVASCTSAAATSTNSYTSTSCNTATTGPTGVALCSAAAASSSNNYLATTCNTLTSGPTAVGSCTSASANSGNNFTSTTCATTNTGPTGVASCTPSAATSTNSYLQTTCSTLTTGPTGVASCTAATADSTNSYTTKTCATLTSGPTPSASCANAAASSTNSYVTTTCNTVTTGPTFVASCIPAGASSTNSYTATTCTPTTSGPTGVASCAASGPTSTNGYTTTSCNTATTGPTGVSSCTPSSATSTNSYTATTCNTLTNGPTPSASCTAATASSTNSWTTTTCSSANTGPTFVQTCTAATASSTNSYVTTSCNTATTGPTGTSSCTPITATSGNNWMTTSCNTATTGPTGVASCTPISAGGGNNYTATTCNTATTGPTPSAACTNAAAGSGNSYVATSCTTATSGPTPSASCTAAAAGSGNSYTTTTCNTVTSGPTIVSSCTPSAASGTNNWTTTTCGSTGGTTNVGTCVPQSPNASNNYTTITCGNNNTGPTGVATCTASPGTSSNGYVTTTCNTVTSGPTLVTSCTPQTAGSGNSYVTRTCSTATTGPTATASCTPVPASSSNNYVSTTCNTVTSGPTGVASCTPSSASGLNNYTNTTCDTAIGGPTAIASCTPVAAGPGNSYVATTCAVATSGPTFVASCTASGPTSANSFVTTTCNTTNTGPTPVASCTDTPAASGNNYLATTCNTVTSGPTGVASCTASGASSTNSYTATTCNTVTTPATGAASCTNEAAGPGNAYTVTTCNTVNTSVFAASCANAAKSAGNLYTSTTCTTAATGPTPTASCSPIAASASNSYLATTCNTVSSGPTGVASCTASPASSTNSYTATTCANVDTGPTGVASCTDSSPTSTNGYVTTTCSTNNNGPTATNSCTNATANSGNGFTTTTCSTSTSTPTLTQSCTVAGATSANGYVSTACAPVTGQKIQYTNTTTTTTYLTSGSYTIGDPTNTNVDVKAATDLEPGACYTPGVAPALPTLPVNGRPSGTLPPLSTAFVSTCTTWPCATNVTGTTNTGSSNSLADVAQYYYTTDLRPSMTNDVAGSGTGPEDDRATWQHMTTFAVGLGVSGTLNYDPNYKSATTGDFADIRSGVKNWPAWPDPTLDYTNNGLLYNDARSIDDFWHAAVDGRGRYFSANDPDAVVNGLTDALAGIKSLSGSGATATLTSSVPTAGDNTTFVSSFTSEKWTGDLKAYLINLTNGNISGTSEWSAQTKLDGLSGNACDNRKIYTFRSGNAGNLAEFTWNTRRCDAAFAPIGSPLTDMTAAQQDYFGITAAAQFTQYNDMSDGTGGTQDQRGAVAGANLVNFLRGQRGMEGFVSNNAGKLYRSREHLLGDIIGSQALYVKEPSYSYQDAGYATFKSDNASRTPVVYVGGNDGMLHAFKAPKIATDADGVSTTTDSTSGTELWAYIPSAIMSKMPVLADTEYGSKHEFLVDGSPAYGDVNTGTSAAPAWKTMVVTGLGAGGKGYFAMDVTNPTSPKAMWEFTYSDTCFDPTSATPAYADCYVGLSFGRPIITKLQDGTWVVLVTSGYNNIAGKALDGHGFLYVLNAATGQILYRLDTGAGDSTTPSGLREINTYVPDLVSDNTTQRVYGGDLLGNVWRFDVNGIYDPAGREASLVARALDANLAPQPITTRIQLAEYDNKTVLLLATGRLLGVGDVADSQVQSVYGFFDTLTASSQISNLRGALKPLVLSTTGTGAAATRAVTCTAGSIAACSVIGNWYIDLTDSGERVNVDPQVAQGVLTFVSNVPESSACSAGGSSWINYVNLLTGESAVGGVVSRKLGDTLSTGLAIYYVNGIIRFGSTNAQTRSQSSDGSGYQTGSGAAAATAGGNIGGGTGAGLVNHPLGKRISWREITDDKDK